VHGKKPERLKLKIVYIHVMLKTVIVNTTNLSEVVESTYLLNMDGITILTRSQILTILQNQLFLKNKLVKQHRCHTSKTP